MAAGGQHTAYPYSIYNIMSFLSFLQSKNYRPSTIQSYLSAISFGHKIRGFQDPQDSFLLNKFMIGIKRMSTASDQLQPITVQRLTELIGLVETLRTTSYIKKLLKAVFSLLYHGCLRISELAKSGRADHALRHHQAKYQFSFPRGKPTSVTLHLNSFKHSKEPVKIKIMSSSDPMICPVQLLDNFQNIRPHSTYLFCEQNGNPISRSFVVRWLNKLVAKSSFANLKINTHSLRIGRTTDLALAGASDAYIRQAGRWSSNAYLKYIRSVVVL